MAAPTAAEEPIESMNLNVLLGLESLSPPRTGIGRYTAALLKEYLALPEKIQVLGLKHGALIDRPEALLQLADEQVPAQDWRGSPLRRALSWVPGIRTAWYIVRKHRGQRALRHLPKGALYHEPNYVAPPLECPLVVTVHDLSHLRFPQYHPAARVRWLERFLPDTIARACKVITASEFSRQEILELLGLPPAKVKVIPLGLDARFHSQEAAALQGVLRRYGLKSQEYIAAVGTLEPRKNLLRLLEAYAALPARLRRRFPLVLAGPKGWQTEALWPRLEPLVRRGEVRWLGYVEEADLPKLYAGAAVFAYLSLYEGFGLPVLEAMGCGAPVLTSQASAMASWAGDAVALVDPLDVEAIRQALARLLEDRLWARSLGARGQAVAKQFSWTRCASETLAVYLETADA